MVSGLTVAPTGTVTKYFAEYSRYAFTSAPVMTTASRVLSKTYSPATSRIRTSPAGKTAVRLNGDACDSTGRFAYAVPARAWVTTSAWTWLMKSRIGVSLYRD